MNAAIVPTGGKQLILFDIEKENIHQQIFAIHSMRKVYPDFYPDILAAEVAQKKREAYLSTGQIGSMIETPEEAEVAARAIANRDYGINYAYWSDLAAGLYTAYTNPTGRDVFGAPPRVLVDRETGKAVKTVLTISKEALYKLALGPVVDDNGRALSGFGEAVRAAKKRLLPIIQGEEVEPKCFVSFNKPQKDGTQLKVAIGGKPIHVSRWTKTFVEIEIDHFFFPIIEGESAVKSAGGYFQQVGGLATCIAGARQILHRKHPEVPWPDTANVHRFLHCMQAAISMRIQLPGLYREKGYGRADITIKRSIIPKIYPTAVDNNGNIRWTKFIDFAGRSGMMLQTAIIETGIQESLPDDIYVPAISKAAQFEKEYPKIVHLKVDRLERIKTDLAGLDDSITEIEGAKDPSLS